MIEQPGRIDLKKVTPASEIEPLRTALGLGGGKEPINVEDILKSNDRITMVGHIHHEHWGEAPFTFPIRSSVILKSQLEPIKKRMKIENVPTPLYLGHLAPDEVGVIAIENTTGKGLLIHPTDNQKKAVSDAILFVMLAGANGRFEVHPYGLPFISAVGTAQDVILMAAGEMPVSINLYLFPR